MIPVAPQPEPQGFDSGVRQRGKSFLAANPGATKLPNYWKNTATDLYTAYKGICASTCMYFVAPGSVDHFVPKSRRPDLAYEWSNYRLALPQVNSYKGDSVDVLDPFVVPEGWFILDFPSCLVRAARRENRRMARLHQTLRADKTARHFHPRPSVDRLLVTKPDAPSSP